MAEMARRQGDYPAALKSIELALADSRLLSTGRKELESYRSSVQAEAAEYDRLAATVATAEAGDADRQFTVLWLRGNTDDAGDTNQWVKFVPNAGGSTGNLTLRLLSAYRQTLPVDFGEQAGARLLVADVDAARAGSLAADLGAGVVAAEEVYSTECDVYAPCAVGATLNRETIPQLRCRAVVGSANNQLAEDADAARLKERNILYAPDMDVLDDVMVDVISSVDIAIIDGTFYSASEIPGAMTMVPHPPVERSMELLQAAVRRGTRVIFTHLNHTNPLCDPTSSAMEDLLQKGFEVAADGMTLEI